MGIEDFENTANETEFSLPEYTIDDGLDGDDNDLEEDGVDFNEDEF